MWIRQELQTKGEAGVGGGGGGEVFNNLCCIFEVK